MKKNLLAECAEALRIDERRLLGYLLGVKAIPSSVALVTVQQFGHGQSNPTYLLRCKDAAGHAVTDVGEPSIIQLANNSCSKTEASPGVRIDESRQTPTAAKA